MEDPAEQDLVNSPTANDSVTRPANSPTASDSTRPINCPTASDFFVILSQTRNG